MYSNHNFPQNHPHYGYPTPHQMYPINQNVPFYNPAIEPPCQSFMSPHDPRCAGNNFNRGEKPVITLQQRQNDEAFIENFIKDTENLEEIKPARPKTNSAIFQTKTALTSACKLNKKLEDTIRELKSNTELSDSERQGKLQDCRGIKSEILQLLDPLKHNEFLSNVKRNLEKRKAKRLREKRKRESWKIEKAAVADRRVRLNAKIDSWIRDKAAEIQKEKQEENLRKDADLVLADVRNKRSDARKYLAVLAELQNLRKIKANVARARGEHISTASDEVFNNIIGKLMEQWTTLDREYSIEEQGLKLMLKADNDEKIEKRKRNIFDDWEIVLFGRKITETNFFRHDFNTFLLNRAAWDKFISCDTEASTIPVGWVVPSEPSSAAWQKCLKRITN